MATLHNFESFVATADFISACRNEVTKEAFIHLQGLAWTLIWKSANPIERMVNWAEKPPRGLEHIASYILGDAALCIEKSRTDPHLPHPLEKQSAQDWEKLMEELAENGRAKWVIREAARLTKEPYRRNAALNQSVVSVILKHNTEEVAKNDPYLSFYAATRAVQNMDENDSRLSHALDLWADRALLLTQKHPLFANWAIKKCIKNVCGDSAFEKCAVEVWKSALYYIAQNDHALAIKAALHASRRANFFSSFREEAVVFAAQLASLTPQRPSSENPANFGFATMAHSL